MKRYKIDKTKNIGNVIFVVEGGRPETGGTELRLLKKIFTDILGYEVQELRRGSEEFIVFGQNPNFRVFALNLPKNQLTQLTEDAMDELFCRLREEFHIKPEDCPIFYLYDRDVLSYKRNELRGGYVKKYTDPYGTDTIFCHVLRIILSRWHLNWDRMLKSLLQMRYVRKIVQTKQIYI